MPGRMTLLGGLALCAVLSPTNLFAGPRPAVTRPAPAASTEAAPAGRPRRLRQFFERTCDRTPDILALVSG